MADESSTNGVSNNSDDSRRTCVMLSKGLVRSLKIEAADHETSVSSVVQQACRAWLKKKD
jgi:hypothetical protein